MGIIRGLALLAIISVQWQENCRAQQPSTVSHGNGDSHKAKHPNARAEEFRTTLTFRFDILNLVTNHQFPGQVNSFHVEYQYVGMLKGGGFDPSGHPVTSEAFPYFQSVRSEIIEYATSYSNKDDFYELFGANICRYIMQRFPQIKRITLTIDIPAYGAVNVDRGETVVVEKSPQQAHHK
jgi:hypothetical protein